MNYLAPERHAPAARRFTLRPATAIAALALLIAATTGRAATEAAANAAAPEFGKWGVQTAHIAPSIAPGDDFYRHVNQGWLDTATIPVGFPAGNAFADLELRSESQLQAIIEEAKAQPGAPGTPQQQIADMHASYVNTARRNALGSSMLQAELTEILNVQDRREIARRMGAIGYQSLVNGGVIRDPGDPSRYVLSLEQGGLGLPGRDYYLKQGKPYTGYRRAYREYIEGVFRRAGVTGARRKAAAILAFETAIAARHWPPETVRDAVRTYNPMATPALARHAPGFDWSAFLAEAGFGDVPRINASTNTSMRALAALFAATPLATLRAYSAFHFLDYHAPLLSDEWVDAHFDMFEHHLSGIGKQPPLQVRAVRFLNATLGEPLGRLYVERYFPPESKAEIDRLVTFLRLAFRERLTRIDWMDEPTRAQALAKLDAIGTKIGYPAQWHDMSTVRIARDDLVGNRHRLMEWFKRDARAKLDGPVRKWEWGLNPQEINAYFDATAAEVVFPAAILQPPFFDPKADPAVNFGAIGMVIGHELGHGFDDQGSRYDGTGALRNWWSDTARRNFDQRTARLVAQYNRYAPLPGLYVNGQLTLGENIGDAGGIAIAWHAYRKFVASEYPGQPPLLDGYTGEQRFFLGYAQLWREVMTESFMRQVTLTNEHSPSEFRVNGVLRNFDPWYDAFGVTPKHALYLAPADRVSIW